MKLVYYLYLNMFQHVTFEQDSYLEPLIKLRSRPSMIERGP